MELKRLLTYHAALEPIIRSEDLKGGGKVKTLEGNIITASVSRQANKPVITIKGAAIIKADVLASNGIVHIIDSVLIPPKQAPTTCFQCSKGAQSLFATPLKKMGISGMNIACMNRQTQHSCMELCLKHDCRSIDFRQSDGHCCLNSVSHISNPHLLSRYWVHYDYFYRQFENQNQCAQEMCGGRVGGGMGKCPCQSMFGEVRSNMGLSGENIECRYHVTMPECQSLCVQNQRCRSIDFSESLRGHCCLNSGDHTTHPHLLSSMWKHYNYQPLLFHSKADCEQKMCGS